MPRIAYIIRSYPRLSQTFIVNEILALEQAGVELALFPITNPREPIVQAQVAEVRAPVEYLEDAPRRSWPARVAEHARAAIADPARYLATLAYVARRTDLDEGYTSATRWECFVYAVHLTRQLQREARAGRPISHIHAHFAHDPTLIALLVQKLTGTTFSFTAHARDLVQIPPRSLVERIARATTMLTCSGTNLDYVDEVVPAGLRDKVRLIHHGVNLDGFQPATENREPRTENHRTIEPKEPRAENREPRTENYRTTEPQGKEPKIEAGKPNFAIPLILSVGRLVEKKGFPDLIAACAQLKARGVRLRCVIFGEGPLEAELAAQIRQLGVEDTVELAGARSQSELIPVFQQADVFALAPFVTDDGDRDGIPNVLVEAMACGLPVVSTAVAGIPELVQSDVNGILVPPRDVAALTDALATVIGETTRRREMGIAARRTVVEHFDLRAAAHEIAALFAQATGHTNPTTDDRAHAVLA